MVKILDNVVTDYFNISIGESKNVRDFCNVAFPFLSLDYNNYIKINPKFSDPKNFIN
jgi:GDP-D-mannose dehydratase